MLTLEGLEIRLDDFRLTADIAIPAGQVTAIIGPSGAGKSTLLSAIAGFVVPVAGRVLWDRRDMTGLSPGARPVSILFQDNNLFAHLSIEQNVGLGLRPDLRLNGPEKEKVGMILAQVGLGGFESRKPGALSGGQQSRAALARVLIAGRPVVLLDEPFAALGPALRDEMLELVRDLFAASGRTVLLVTHDPADARRIAANVVVVAEGAAAPPMPTRELFANPPAALGAYLGRDGQLP
jgi:thiamine transport system ATP-binding protein